MVIKEVIREHGFTLQDVAHLMGVQKSTFSSIVNGSPTVKKLREIADIIGCKVGDFFRDEISEPIDEKESAEPINENETAIPTIVCPNCGHELKISIVAE